MGPTAGGHHPLRTRPRLCVSAFVQSHGHAASPHELSVIQSTRSDDHTVSTITQFTNSSRSAFPDVIRYTHHASHKGIRIMSYVIQFIHNHTTHNALSHTNVVTNYTIKMTLRYFLTLLCIYTQRPGRPISLEVFTSSLTPAGPW